MSIDRNTALDIWQEMFGDVRWMKDCFGAWMCKEGYGDKEYNTRMTGDDRDYDYSWNIDHIRPKSDFDNDADADFNNNFEPMHRKNNQMKSDNYPHFKIDNESYTVVKCDICSSNGEKGYGIKNSSGERVDWKGVEGKYYKTLNK